MNVFVQTLLKMYAYLWFALHYVALLPRKNARQTFFSVEKNKIKLCCKMKPKRILGSKMVTKREQSLLHFENQP